MKQMEPLLIVLRIEAENPEAVSAELLRGGHVERIELDFSYMDFIGFTQIPNALSHHLPALNAVIDLLARKHRGENVALPADLTAVVRQSNESWPLRVPDNVDECAVAAVPISVKQVERSSHETGVATVQLDFYGAPAQVIVDRSRGRDRPVRFRFVAGVHPWQLSAVEQYALLVALLSIPERPPGKE